MPELPNWFRRVRFIHGLPRAGKTVCFYRIIKKDHNQDLVLNLAGRKIIEGIRYTTNTIKARKRPPIHIFQVPKYNGYARYYFLKAYKADHPKIKHILIDEVERYTLYDLIRLCKNIYYFYPKVPIILAGIELDGYNHKFVTSEYLVHHCISKNINPTCKFCKRKSVYALNIYHHHKVTYTDLDLLPPKKRKHIKRVMARFNVCLKHYENPPKKALESK